MLCALFYSSVFHSIGSGLVWSGPGWAGRRVSRTLLNYYLPRLGSRYVRRERLESVCLSVYLFRHFMLEEAYFNTQDATGFNPLYYLPMDE